MSLSKDTDVSKPAFLTIAALIAAILSLSLTMASKAFVASDDGDSKTKFAPGNNRPAPHVNCQCVETGKFPDKNKGGDGGATDNGGSTHNKVGKINRLFRSNNIETGSSALDSIPVIPKMNFDTVNGTNYTSTKTATVTIPVCDGVVPGPCLDKKTGQTFLN
jgi:hypothetical protein